MSLSKPRTPLTAFRERVSMPGERSLCWALAGTFSSERVWQYLKQHPDHVDTLINNFLKHVMSNSDATDWQKKQRKRDLHKWMDFCPHPGTCTRGRKACARCETGYWKSDKVLHVWLKCADTLSPPPPPPPPLSTASGVCAADPRARPFARSQRGTRHAVEALPDLDQAALRQVSRR